MTLIAPSTILSASKATRSLQSPRFVFHCCSLFDTELTQRQERYHLSARSIPGQWPEEYLCVEEAATPIHTGTFFSTAARFATSVTLEAFKIPFRLVQRFTRQQQIRAVPIIRDDGASKRRLVDAGLGPTTSTRRHGSGDCENILRQHLRNPDDVTHDHLPSFWVNTPSTASFGTPHPEDQLENDIDDSLDWSMEDIDSGTVPCNPKTGLSMGASWSQRRRRKTITPNSQFAKLKKSSATPMRKQLLKKQLRTVEAAIVPSPIQQHPDHTLASTLPYSISINDLKKTKPEPPASPNAPAVIANVQGASAQYQTELKARENLAAGARASAERSHYNTDDIIDIDLSHHPDTSNIDSTITPHTPKHSPPHRKQLRWAPQSNIKTFYFDERVSEMLDSALESIRSPTPKSNSDDDESSEDVQEATLEEPEARSDLHGSVNGSSLDRSLEETQLSKELIQGLEEDFKNLFSQASLPAPKPLISPLSDKERAQLDDIVTKSKHGRDEAYPIVPHKVSARDFGTLLPALFNGSAKAWLNDEIVNEYLVMLVKQLNKSVSFSFKRGGPAPPYHAFSSHWYNSIKGGVKNVERWANRAGLGGEKFLDAKVILYPICDSSHWRLLAVKPQERIIEYLDSLGWDGDKYVDKLRLYLKHELKEFYKEEEWTVVEQQRSSRQLNGSDCGVFVLLNALALLRGDDTKKVIACNGMLEARERMAITIITGHASELDH